MPFAVRSYDGGLPYIQRMDNASRSDFQDVYVGWADPGTATSSALWRIFKITYDTDAHATAIQFANGSRDFDQIWDNRASLSYK